MKDLGRLRCFNHGLREAAAICLECGRSFCRECVTEHEDRVLCSSCLNRVTGNVGTRASHVNIVFNSVLFMIAVGVLWLSFYYFGKSLISLPVSFHDGTLWHTGWWLRR